MEVRRIYGEGIEKGTQVGDRNRLTQDAKAMLEVGLEPERVARILRETEELAQLTGDAACNATM